MKTRLSVWTVSMHSATPQDLETLQDALQQPSDGLNPEAWFKRWLVNTK